MPPSTVTENYQQIDYSQNPSLTRLEASVLTEYQNINKKLIKINAELKSLSLTDDPNNKSGIMTKNLRELEMKLPLIYTLFKSSVYGLYTREDDANAEFAEGTIEEAEEEIGSEGEGVDGQDGQGGHDRDHENNSNESFEKEGKNANELLSISDAEGLDGLS